MTIFTENFSDNSKNWHIQDSTEISLRVENSGYIIEHRQDLGWWATWKDFTNHTSGDLGIHVKIQKILGASNSYYGIIWGLVDKNKFNYLLVNFKKQFTVGKYINNEWNNLTNWLSAPIRHEAGTVNEISIFTQKDIIEIHINGFQVLKSEWRNSITGNNIGFLAGHSLKIKVLSITVHTEDSVQIPKTSRFSSPTIKRTYVDSSNLKSVGYDNTNRTLEIEFANGTVYQFYAVPQRTYVELMQAESHGKYFYASIRDRFQYQMIKEKSPQQTNYHDDNYDDDEYDYDADARAHFQDLYDMGLTDDDLGGRD